MSANIELKAAYPDLDKARSTARALGAAFGARERQRDTYFRVAAGRLKLREVDGAAWLIPYSRPNSRTARRSDYELIAVAAPEKVRELLGQILGVSLVVEKLREIYLWENVRLHLDEVTGLGHFIEFEAVLGAPGPEAEAAGRDQLVRLMTEFEIDQAALIDGSYHDLLLANRGPAAQQIASEAER